MSFQFIKEILSVPTFSGQLLRHLNGFSTGSAKLNGSTNRKIAARMLVYFVLTSLINAILGTVLVLSIHPGDPHRKVVSGEENLGRKARILDGILDLGRWVNSGTFNKHLTAVWLITLCIFLSHFTFNLI